MEIELKKSAAFTDYRQPSYHLEMRINKDTDLNSVVENLYSAGYRIFLCGMANGYEMEAAEAVLKSKVEHSDIKLLSVVAYMGQCLLCSEKDRERFEKIFFAADEHVFTSQNFSDKEVILKHKEFIFKNAFMIIHSR